MISQKTIRLASKRYSKKRCKNIKLHAENKATHQECSILIKEEKRNDRKMKNQVRELSNDKEEQMDQETQERKEECKRLEEGLELKEEVL